MIIEFIQKALLKNEKSCSVLVKDEKLKNDILSGVEIDKKVLEKVYNKDILKRKDFTRLEEIIKMDLDKKIAETDESKILFDLISEDFKQYDKTTIKNRLLKREYLYITGKTLYEHLINRRENSLEQIRQNRLLFFLDIPYQDWNFAENLDFEKYYRIPAISFYAVFSRNIENKISKAMLVYNDTFEKVEFSVIDKNFSVKTKLLGKGYESYDFFKFDFEQEKRYSPLILFMPKLPDNILKGNTIRYSSQQQGFISKDTLFIKAKDSNEILDIIRDETQNDMVGLLLCNENTSFQGYSFDTLKNQPKTAIINAIAGSYICYTIGKEKDKIRSQKFAIQKDCSVLFSSSNLHHDNGYANISDADKILQIHFHFEEGEYKYKLLLQLNNSDIKAGKLQGVVCGINRLNEPFAERVFLVRMNEDEIEPEDFKVGTEKLSELFTKLPELLSVFIGEKNDFCADFKSLQTFYKDFYLPKQQDISRIAGVFEVFSYDIQRESIRQSILQILPNGDTTLKCYEKSQAYKGKCEINEPDMLIINLFKSSMNNHFHGMIISLLDGFDIEGIQNFISFFTGKNEKNELVTIRQVCIKSDKTPELACPALIPINSPEFEAINKTYFGVGSYLTGKTNNVLKTDLTVNHSLKPETDFGRLYFESACFAATHNDKTRALQQMELAFNHGFKNKKILQDELCSGNLQLIANMVDVENLKVLS